MSSGFMSAVRFLKYFGDIASQVPDRSGWPSGARGAGAVKLGFPSGPRGIGGGTFTHCAHAGATTKTIATVTSAPICHRLSTCMTSPEKNVQGHGKRENNARQNCRLMVP